MSYNPDAGGTPAASGATSGAASGGMLAGDPGDDGAQGPPGPAGAAGSTGAQGPQGVATFLEAADGEEGPQGPPGVAGATGAAGSNGATGATGAMGPAIFLVGDGEEGPMGPPGQAGATGPAGSGSTGAQGPMGPILMSFTDPYDAEPMMMPPNVPPRWTMVTVGTLQNVTNSSTLVDSVLKFSMLASRNYIIRMVAIFDTTAAGDMKYQFTGPASPTRVRLNCQDKPPAATAITTGMLTAFSSVRTVLSASTDGGSVIVDGLIENGVNAGDVVFQFAQNTLTNDAGVTLRVGSYLEWTTAN